MCEAAPAQEKTEQALASYSRTQGGVINSLHFESIPAAHRSNNKRQAFWLKVFKQNP